VTLCWALSVPGSAAAQTSIQLVSVETYGTFHAAGVVAIVGGDSDRDGAAALEWRHVGEPAFRAAQPLVRVDATHFVGSLFFLRPGNDYEVQVTVTDPDGVSGPASATTPLSTRSPLAPFVPLRTLYVELGGSDSNPGTDPDFPLATIQAAADLSQPGDLISIAPGVYRESVDVPTSGTADHPIVFRGSAPGAILDGADEAIANGVAWSNDGAGVWSRTIGFATGHVVSDQGRLFRYDNLSDLQALAAGPPGGFFFDGTTLRVKFTDGSTPAARTLHVARLENGFLLDGISNVRIENLELRHYGAGDYGKGVYLRYSSDCVVRESSIHEVGAAGVWIKGGTRNVVEDNEIWDTSIPGWDWNWTKGSSAEDNAVVLTDDVGRGNVVRRNLFHGTFNAVGGCGDAPPPSGFTTETDLYDNLLWAHNDDGFEPEGYCANVRMWGNRIHDVHMAFAVAPAAPGPTWIVRNVAWNFGSTRTSQQDGYLASALKINSGYSTPVGPLLLYQNTFWTTAPDTAALTLLNPGESTWLRSRNNVIAGTAEAIYKVNPIAVDLDHDDLWRSTAGRLAYWLGSSYADLDALRVATGQETNGFFAAPGLVDPAGGDFTPGPASPLVDSALPLPGINDSPIGDPPDVGAVERSFLFADDFEEGSTAAWSTALL